MTTISSHQSREKYATSLTEPVRQKSRLVCKSYKSICSSRLSSVIIDPYSIALHLETRAGRSRSGRPCLQRDASKRSCDRYCEKEAQRWSERERQDPWWRAMPGGQAWRKHLDCRWVSWHKLMNAPSYFDCYRGPRSCSYSSREAEQTTMVGERPHPSPQNRRSQDSTREQQAQWPWWRNKVCSNIELIESLLTICSAEAWLRRWWYAVLLLPVWPNSHILLSQFDNQQKVT